MLACGGPSSGTQSQAVVICPSGSILDPQKQLCVAMEPTKPVVVDESVASGSATVTVASASASTAVATPPIPPLPPPTSGFAVDVQCAFTKGWVTLLPVNKYPKDDQFLMQSLIGLTKDPSFWNGLPEYRVLQPFAAKRCNPTSPTRLLAPTAGDYYLLAGQEDTFSLRGTYDKNGVRRKITVNATQAITLGASDLVFTWLCISCPWVVFGGEHGRDLAPFVVLANRRGRRARGSDVHAVAHVPVVSGRVVLRLMEVEEEDTHVDALVLRASGHELTPDARTALDLAPHTQVTLSYIVPGVSSGFVDVEVEATGYYDPR